MSGSRNTADDVDIDLARLFSSLARQWARILLGALAIAGAAFVLAWLATPKYKAETRILIETRESVFTRPDASAARDDANSPTLDEEGVLSQVEVILSSDILTKVAGKLGLASLPEYDDVANASALDRILVLTGLKRDPGEIPAEERVLKRFRENLGVYRVERSRVIVIEFISEDPRLAAEVANAIADEYIATSRAAKLASNTDATEWLAPEIADLTRRVRDAEAKVAQYRAQSDLLVGQNNSVLATQQLSELSSELSRVRAGRAAAEANAEGVRGAIRSGASLDALPEVLSSPLIQRLRERQVQLRADIADLSTTLLDNHPRIRSMNSQLADLEAQIRREADNVLKSMETAAETARVREQQLVADLNRMKAESARAGEEEVNLRALEREAAAQRELLNSYLTRYREASSRQDRSYLPADARVFSRALVPSEPYFPRMLPIVGAAFGAGLILMTIATLLRELFSGRAMRPVESARLERADPQVLPEVEPAVGRGEDSPIVKPVPPRPVAVKMPSGFGEIGIAEAAERLIARGVSRALFVSPEGDEAAASAVLVARAVSDAGLRVLLLDLTASGAAAVPMLENAGLPGITDLLAAQAQFTEVIHPDLYSDAHVIPAGNADPALAMKAIERLPIIMDALVTAYDIVVVECGPADVASIQRLIGEGAEIMISVLEPHDRAVAESTAALDAAGFHGVSLVTPEGYEAPPPVSGRTAAARSETLPVPA